MVNISTNTIPGNSKKKQSPSDIRRNVWRKQVKEHIKRLEVLDKAPPEGCTVAHVLSQREVNEIVSHGATVIHLTNPKRNQDTGNISWAVASKGTLDGNGDTLLTNSVLFLTTYDQLEHDPKILFLGSYYSAQPDAKDWVLLSLVMQRQEQSAGVVDDDYIDVAKTFSDCSASKPNIVDGNSSNHHGSQGWISGFGARRDFGKIKQENGSSIGQYICNKGQEAVASVLEDHLMEEMNMAHQLVYHYAKQDLHKMNAVQLMATEQQAVKNNYVDDFHLKDNTCYTSLYYNFNASTREFHTEMDWTMTTLFVPLQDWTGKNKDHLVFQFRLDEKGQQMVNVAMVPGTLIYFHGYLLTHRQMHDKGRCYNRACCLNYSAYANKALRWCSYKTNARARKITAKHA